VFLRNFADIRLLLKSVEPENELRWQSIQRSQLRNFSFPFISLYLSEPVRIGDLLREITEFIQQGNGKLLRILWASRMSAK
jgi:hypothetical protein